MNMICVCALISVVYLDHVKVALIRENSIHLTVQLLEVALDAVGRQCVIAPVFVDVIVACKKRGKRSETMRVVALQEDGKLTRPK